jgi:hypothetical protein
VIRRLSSLSVAVALLAASGEARADMAGWFSVGFGGARLQADGVDPHWRYHLPFNVGMGAPPSLPVFVGVGARLDPYFLDGFDWAAYARIATRSYVTGYWGVALDGGGYSRSFGQGSSGWMTTLNVGGPWGFIVSGNLEMGSNGAKTTSFTLGIDLLRLTVFRLSGEQQWPNVNPAWRPATDTPATDKR